MTRAADLERFLDAHPAVARVALVRVLGSSPREAGAEMFVSADDVRGTIGGGQLEFVAIARARALLAEGGADMELEVPLGPEIGQCCGGHVSLGLSRLDAPGRAAALERAREAERSLPQVLLLGSGHVGRALADLLQHLPVRTVLVDMREDELGRSAARVEKRTRAVPEAEIRSAPAGSAFVVATHDHGLDFLLAAAALERGDAAYVGLIGSASKRARFARWCREHSGGLSVEALTCPIGQGGSADKRPSVIAAMAVAEIMTALTRAAAAAPGSGARSEPTAGMGVGRL